MNDSLKSRIAKLPCWQSDITIETLSGGMTNHNFKVQDGKQSYVVRIGSDDPIHLISRINEAAASRAAFEVGVSPELIYNEPGVLVVRFIEGQVYEEADVRNEQNLPRIVEMLHRYHHQTPKYFHEVPVMFWVFQVLRHYQHLLTTGNSLHHDRLPGLAQIAETLEKSVGAVEIVYGHNDLLAANFIDDGEKIWLIDFDYAGFNSPLFDLSNLASNNELSPEQEVTMLGAYFGSSFNRQQWTSYHAMKCASLLRETMWSMVAEIHSELDVDFPEYTRKNLERFEQAFESFQSEYQ
jgi:thiamine kinase-like enzyme